MLIQLIVRNVYSFRDETVFSLASGEGAPPQTIAGVYGANAAGKSNLVKALQMLRALVVDGTRTDEPLPRKAFLLDEHTRSLPSTFEVIFDAADHRFEYALTYSPLEVENEELWCDGARVFTRHRQDVEMGTVWPNPAQFMAFVAEGTRPNQPFLTEAASKNVEGALAVRTWFQVGLALQPSTASFTLDAERVFRDDEFRRFLATKLAAWETGVSDIHVEKIEGPAGTVRVRRTWFAAFGGKLVPESDDEYTLTVRLQHATSGSGGMPLPFSDESDGTRVLLGLLPLLFDGPPRTIVIDELDRSLHAALTRRFVDEFREMNERTGGKSQLIFTSHDTTLLTGALKRPEELWFAEKDGTGASSLYSLADFKPEQIAALSNDLAQGYLSGRFGAVPFPIPTGVPGWMRGTGS